MLIKATKIQKMRKMRNKRNKSDFKKEVLRGRVSMTREGYGFVTVEGMDADIFVSASALRGALHKDLVEVNTLRVKDRNEAGVPNRIEGKVIRILERSSLPYVGVLTVVGKEVWVIVESRNMPYDIRITYDEMDRFFGQSKWSKSKLSGTKVAVVVADWPRKESAPLGKIFDILGQPGDNDTEMHAILAQYGLPYRFEKKIEDEADLISEVISENEIAKRKDYRKVTTFTIDPADAKDFDDAISYQKLDNGNIEVGVHIADVTHYVRPGTILDDEAFQRGTSVYLVDRTVPMLPEKLSNKLCSLRPQEEKLCFAAIFEIDSEAQVVNKWFGRTVIKSDIRYSYEEAQEVIETGAGPLAKEITELWDIASLLRKKRFEVGAVMFDRAEMKVQVDEKGAPISIYQKISKEANWLIEEYMLLANMYVAEFIGKVPKGKTAKTFVYRIHEDPNADKIQGLRNFAGLFGHKLATTGKLSLALNKLLNKVKGKPEASAIEILALRSMARARYSTDNMGHYGLAFKHYTHFTSPIRRYPDMMVHRLLADYLDDAPSADKMYYEDCCDKCSEREQVATEAERTSIKYKLVEFMQDKIGFEYDGSISGLTEWGIYVEIEPTKVEGMIALRTIKGDYYAFDEETYSIIGTHTKRKFMLGDKVKIRVKRASLEQRLLDYELIDD